MPSSRESSPSSGSKDYLDNKNESKNFADRLKSLCTSFKDWTSFEQLKHRDAVLLINGHLFQTETLTELTYCSNCCSLIYGLKGQKCKLCNVMCHQRCLKSTGYSCRKQKIPDNCDSLNNSATNLRHQFEKTTFLHPTYCDHCGVMIMGFYKQGLECKSGCKMKAHDDCKDLVGMSCSIEPRPSKSIFSGSFKSMIARLNPMINIEPSDRVKISPVSIEDFQIERPLGEGSFGKVYLATYTGSNRLDTSRNRTKTGVEQYAIKVVKKTTLLVSSSRQSALTERKVLNFGHKFPFLAKCHCCFHSSDRLFYVMDYVAGRDLLYHICKSIAKRLSEHQSRFYGAEIVLALRYLHNNHIIHRDLKLDNIILDQTGHCKLLDFGMSKDLLESNCSLKTGTFCGTPEYIAPEIIKQEQYDYSVDWWAFGVLMFEMMVGYTPFQCEDDGQLYQMITSKQVSFPRWLKLSEESRNLIEGLLTKDPRNRLGCQPLEGLSKALLEHSFFMFEPNESGTLHKSFQWDAIQNLIIPPPAMSSLKDPDVSASLSSINRLSPIEPSELENISQSEFNNFSYCCSSFMSITSLK